MGSCPTCDGLGNTNFFDPEKVVAHPELSLATGAIDGWDKRNQFYFQMIQSLARHYGFDVQAAWETLPEKVKKVVLHGSGKEVIDFTYLSERGTTFNRSHAFEGSFPISNAVTAKPTAKPCAKNCANTKTTAPARAAAAHVCAKKRATFTSAANRCMKSPPGR